jgi:hypothetical protein
VERLLAKEEGLSLAMRNLVWIVVRDASPSLLEHVGKPRVAFVRPRREESGIPSPS